MLRLRNGAMRQPPGKFSPARSSVAVVRRSLMLDSSTFPVVGSDPRQIAYYGKDRSRQFGTG